MVLTGRNGLSSLRRFLLGGFFQIVVFLLILPSAFAIQAHIQPEGLVAHLIAHVFFLFSMIVLFIRIRASSYGGGWHYIGISALIFALWNVDTITTHIAGEYLNEQVPSGNGLPLTAKVYYAGSLIDHVLAVSGMFFFLLGVRALAQGETRGDALEHKTFN
jgi:hypothetical protein